MKISGIEISHPEKIIFPRHSLTKLDMIKYYDKVAEEMLPYLKDRPLTLHRFPDGVDKSGFYQKNASDYFPDFIQTIRIKTEDGENIQVICNSKKSLIYLANQGTVTFHIWLSKKDKLDKPDKVVFDLDPSDADFEKVKKGAKIVAAYLRKKAIDPYLMTTGQHGLHVWYQIRRTRTYDQLKPSLKQMAMELEQKNPQLFTTAIRKNKRDGKIFIDYLRNEYAQTSVCPFSLRPNENGGIAMPLDWSQLSKIKSANEFNLAKSIS